MKAAKSVRLVTGDESTYDLTVESKVLLSTTPETDAQRIALLVGRVVGKPMLLSRSISKAKTRCWRLSGTTSSRRAIMADNWFRYCCTPDMECGEWHVDVRFGDDRRQRIVVDERDEAYLKPS